MFLSLNQILPSLQSLGVLAYWLIGLSSGLEAFFLTGVVIPGTLIVDAGGVLAQKGVLDLYDLMWFVGIGSIIGNEASFLVGRATMTRLKGRFDPQNSPGFGRARRLFEHYGRVAIVLGRFAGPAAGFVPFVAALSGMQHRRFSLWNVVGAVPYAVGHVLFGYFLGHVFARFGGFATRIALFLAAALVLLGLLWFVVRRLRRGIPFLVRMLRQLGGMVLALPAVQRRIAAHPRAAAFIGARFTHDHVLGLPATLIAALFLWLAAAYAESVFEFLTVSGVAGLDERLAALIHVFRNPGLIRVASWLTALGDWRVVTLAIAGAGGAAILLGRYPLAAGLAVAALGNSVTVDLLKRVFDRPRPPLAYFVETSGSFPSGHAAISAAVWGYLFYMLWRLRRLDALSAALLAVTLAFLIGLSRLYLIEHYLSDVVNGWIVGGMWLLIGASVAEWLRLRRTAPPRLRRWASPAAAALAIVAAAVAGWQVAVYSKARAPAPAVAVAELADPAALLAAGSGQGYAETVLGDPEGPVNVIFSAPDLGALDTAIQKAGWVPARMPTPGDAVSAVWADLTGGAMPADVAAPTFWDNQPNAAAYFSSASGPPGAEASADVLRVWRTGFRLPSGAALFVGSAGTEQLSNLAFDRGVASGVDARRDALAAALEKSAGARLDAMLPVAPPAPAPGIRLWQSDNRAALLSLPR